MTLRAIGPSPRGSALSPEEWDAVALTFAEPVGPENLNFGRQLIYARFGGA